MSLFCGSSTQTTSSFTDRDRQDQDLPQGISHGTWKPPEFGRTPLWVGFQVPCTRRDQHLRVHSGVAVNTRGKTQGTTVFRKPRETLLQRAHSPLPFLEDGECHGNSLLQLSVLVLDESHDAKNEESVLNESLCNLRFSKAILATATPESNSDRDWAGQLKILGLIDGLEHFNSLFYNQTGRGNRGELQKHLLRPLVANLVVAREKTLVSLPGLTEVTSPFGMNGMECEPFLIAWLVERAETCMKKAEESASQTENATRGHRFFAAAQKVAGVMPAILFEAHDNPAANGRLMVMLGQIPRALADIGGSQLWTQSSRSRPRGPTKRSLWCLNMSDSWN
ncbi:uncharacterized protein F5Z01DRAFT_662812 [Emericellopsis atlantica]|uniref:SNF2 N-terminal domain-containing protein n=1 Tax=Emericellopsis atlantica TaxID=2614577 RepID=A0A9P7ZHF4_9HYPO|nr:uncharacterized protein F5Z01DRAFT_662812 [Emericellopsis atlantica]KAG9251747.1 hypothetical protein F5Z01DRAFT_662812 [Emericellopsis atlantica]